MLTGSVLDKNHPDNCAPPLRTRSRAALAEQSARRQNARREEDGRSVRRHPVPGGRDSPAQAGPSARVNDEMARPNSHLG
jgi:hypothetical protein